MLESGDGAWPDFLRTVAASGIGFALMRLFTAWLESRFSKARFLEAERDSDTARAGELIDGLVKDGCEYWSAETTATLPKLAYKIPPDLLEVGGIFESLFEDYPVLLRDLQVGLNRLDQCITGAEFGSATRPTRLEKIREIRTAAGSLRTDLRTKRRLLRPAWFG